MADQAHTTNRRTMLAGLCSVVTAAPALAALPSVSEVERAATAFFAVEDGPEIVAAFNAVMAAPSESLDDLKVKLLVERRFSARLEGGGSMGGHAGFAIYRDLCRMTGTPLRSWY